MSDSIQLLRLLHLADSALPVGAAAHSFGVEMLVANASLDVPRLGEFLRSYIEESAAFEAWFVQAGQRIGGMPDATAWRALNAHLSAFKAARESRVASLTMGRRLLQLLASLESFAVPAGDAHYSVAFGFVAGVLGLSAHDAALAYVRQSVAGIVSCAQRLLPFGQQSAQQMLWNLESAMASAVVSGSEDAPPACFVPMPDIGSMQHTRLDGRLFIS